MTEVFFLMWLADVVGSLATICSLSAVGLLCAGAFVALDRSLDAEELSNSKYARSVVVAIVVLTAISVLTPSRSTIQIAAAASATQAAASTDVGKKGLEAVNAVLDGIIKKSKE